ncbi:YbaB/EbfC family nucleoid-associated protein [Streptomyces sp. NPDC059215]|uniref:YbaB/EbfC family nucleoid-associated protein n=1 Tax=Streptomyces sp. NPDC059215 TaxID=3346772 RepID=UPI0036AA3C88
MSVQDGNNEPMDERNSFVSSIEQRITDAMAHLEATEAAVAKAEAELREKSVTMRSPDRSVEVTVGHQGELVGLRFLEGKYRTMAAAELAAVVLETATQARTLMSRQVMAAFEPFTQPNAKVPELSGFDIDWAKIFGPSVLEEPEVSLPRAGSRHLRDEIGDDVEE